jgi:hypothetical protein
VYTSYGWTWVSDYNWGWAPFHYGRWIFDDSYGWIWVPGDEWGPAWVAWRESAGYYGWAPLGPGLSVGISIGFNTIPAARWTFLPSRYICSPNLRPYYIDRGRNVTIINNTTIINNVHVNNNGRNGSYYTGPRVDNMQRVIGQPVRTFAVNTASRPGQAVVSNNQVRIFRPTVERTANDHAAPARVYNMQDVRPANRQENLAANANSGRPSVNAAQPRGTNTPTRFRNEYNDNPGNNSNAAPARTFNRPAPANAPASSTPPAVNRSSNDNPRPQASPRLNQARQHPVMSHPQSAERQGTYTQPSRQFRPQSQPHTSGRPQVIRERSEHSHGRD